MNKKLSLAAVTLLLGFLFFPRHAHAAAPNSTDLISSGTSCNFVASGGGTLFSISISSGAAGEYAVCYDTTSCTGITTTFIPSPTVPEVMRVFVAATNTTTGPPASQPIVNFNNGLACIQSVAERTKIYWRQPN